MLIVRGPGKNIDDRDGDQHLHQSGEVVVIDVRAEDAAAGLDQPEDHSLAREKLQYGKEPHEQGVGRDHESEPPPYFAGSFTKKLARQEKHGRIRCELDQGFPRRKIVEGEMANGLDHSQQEKQRGRYIERRPEDSDGPPPDVSNGPEYQRGKGQEVKRRPPPGFDGTEGEGRSQKCCEQEGPRAQKPPPSGEGCRFFLPEHNGQEFRAAG